MEIKKFKPKMPEFIKKMPKWLKITSAAALAIILILIISLVSRAGGPKKAAAYTDYTVARGNISVEITGSGAVEPIDQYEVKPLVSGDIIECYIEEGQMVEKGDLLYKIDTKDIENTIERAQNSLEKAQIAYDDAIKMRDDLKVKSSINGSITAVYAKEGDNIGNGSKVVDIIDSSVMELEIPFLANDAANIYAGQSATVTLTNSYYKLTGTVSRVTTGTFVSSEGVAVSNIYINVNNPGAIAKGDGATATIGTYACNSAGTFDYNATRTVTAKVSGEIINLPFKVGDKVRAGETIMTIDGENVDDTIRNATYSLKDARLSLQNAQDQLDNYNITAPIAGKVIKKTSKAGDSLEGGAGNSVVMAVIADMSKIVFDISVDELDITKLAVGQEVNITADAFEDRRFSGRVDYVSSIGTTSNGVTTYPVTITYMRDGKKVNKSDIAQYDILYYSTAMDTVWSYSKKVTGVFEKASPNKDNVTSVTVSGTTYQLESAAAMSALSSGGKFELGDSVTLLLGKDGRVADVMDPSGINEVVYGILKAVGTKAFTDANGNNTTSYYADVVLTNGNTVTYPAKSKYNNLINNPVRISVKGGEATVSKINSGDDVYGKVNASKMKLGTFALAQDVEILDVTTTEASDTLNYTTVFPARLDGVNIPSSDVLYYSKNVNGEIDKLIIEDVTGDAYSYGIVKKATTTERGGTYEVVIGTENKTVNSATTKFLVQSGQPAKFADSGTLVSKISGLSVVPDNVTAVTSTYAETANSKYALSDKVVCYDENYMVVPISDVIGSNNYTVTAYHDRHPNMGGRIRVLKVKSK